MSPRKTIAVWTLLCLLGSAALQFMACAWISWRSWPECAQFSQVEVPWGAGLLHQNHEPATQGGQVATEYVSTGFGWQCRMAGYSQQPLADGTFRHAGLRTAGWPLAAFAGGYESDLATGGPRHYDACMFEQPPTQYHMWAFIPLRPIWSGLLADTAMVASLGALLLHGPGLVRRSVRRRRGRCVRCGHTLAGAKVCPECGASVRPA